MAIKVSGTTVIDDTRALVNISNLSSISGTAIYKNSTFTDPLIAYGDSKLISEIIDRMGSVEENRKPLLSDGIFYGGETAVLSPMPPLAWSLDKELPVLVTSAEWDAKTYIQTIPNFTNEVPNE